MGRRHAAEGIGADPPLVHPVNVDRSDLIPHVGGEGEGLAAPVLHRLLTAGGDAAASSGGGGDLEPLLLELHSNTVGCGDLPEGVFGNSPLADPVHRDALDLVPGVGDELHPLVSAIAYRDRPAYRSGGNAAPGSAGHGDTAGVGVIAEAAAVPSGHGLCPAAAVIPAVRSVVLIRRIVVPRSGVLRCGMGFVHALLGRRCRCGIAPGQCRLVLVLGQSIRLLLRLQLPLERRCLLIRKAEKLLRHADLLRRGGLLVQIPVGIVGGGLGSGVVVPRLQGVVGASRLEHGLDAGIGKGGGGIAVHPAGGEGGGVGHGIGLAGLRAGGGGLVPLGVRNGPGPFFVIDCRTAVSRRLLRQLLVGLVELVAKLRVPGVVGDPPGRRILRHLLRDGLARRRCRTEQHGEQQDCGAEPVQDALRFHLCFPPFVNPLPPGGRGCGRSPDNRVWCSCVRPRPSAKCPPP